MWQALPGTRDVKMSEPQTLTLGGLRASGGGRETDV